jgi:hypothetical protein
MKKLSALIVAALFASYVHAQTSKGTVALTATFGYSQTTGSAEKEEYGGLYKSESHSYTFAPSLGFFVKDNLELGASVYINDYKTESLSPYYASIHRLSTEGVRKNFRAFARQYKFLTPKLAVYGMLSAGLYKEAYSYSSHHTGTQIQKYVSNNSYSTISAALSPGLTYFASNSLGLSVNLGALTYSRRKVDDKITSVYMDFPEQHYDTKYNSNILELDFSGINLNFSLTYFISK